MTVNVGLFYPLGEKNFYIRNIFENILLHLHMYPSAGRVNGEVINRVPYIACGPTTFPYVDVLVFPPTSMPNVYGAEGNILIPTSCPFIETGITKFLEINLNNTATSFGIFLGPATCTLLLRQLGIPYTLRVGSVNSLTDVQRLDLSILKDEVPERYSLFEKPMQHVPSFVVIKDERSHLKMLLVPSLDRFNPEDIDWLLIRLLKKDDNDQKGVEVTVLI